MNTIMGITEMQLHTERLPENLREAFGRIHFSGDLLLGIINDLLDLSKIESGKLEIMPARYEVPSLLHEVVQLNKLRFDSSPVKFTLDIGENVPEMLIGDELRIKQVLNNLLTNAFKYTDSGEIAFSVNAETGADGEVTLVFVVRDPGQGMTEKQTAALFDRYTRFNREKNRAVEGVGLGMNITHNMVKMMNGDIHVESRPGLGSVFTVRLPQRTDGSGAVISREVAKNLAKRQIVNSAQVKKAQILRKYMPYGKVLVVDDTEANLYVAKLLLTPYGLNIQTAASGKEAIERVRGGGVYDIIFMDHMMPVMDGIEAVHIISGMGYAAPIIALTANAVAGQADIFLTNGFDDFVSKPIDMRLLNAILNKYIYDKQAPEVLASAKREKEQLEQERIGVEARQAGGLEALPDVSWLNAGHGLALFDGEADTYLSALHSYVKNVPEMLAALRVVTEESLPEYAVQVHALKSVSGWISADGIRAKAANLEALAKAGDLLGVMTLNTDLLDEIEACISDLRVQLKHVHA
jgi:CheY-like chemotaxis protein